MFNILLCRSSAFFGTFRHIWVSWRTIILLIVELLEKLTENSSLVRLIDYFISLKTLIILFLLYICVNYVSNQNGKVQEEILAGSNSDIVKTTLRLYIISKWPSLFFKFFKNLSPFPCHFVTYNREYYEWLCRLRCHIQVGRLLV